MKLPAIIGCLCALSTLGCGNSPEAVKVPLSVSEGHLKRGEYLVKGPAACGFCHGARPHPEAPLSGGRKIGDIYGDILAPNITPAKSGIKGWNLPEIINAIRESKRRDGTPFSSTAHRGYEWMSDNDALSIASYLTTLTPVENTVSRRAVGVVSRNTIGLFRRESFEVKGYVPDIEKGESEAYGRYLVHHVARCGFCHTSDGGFFSPPRFLGGGKVIRFDGKQKVAPNITTSKDKGIGSWSEEDIRVYLKTGRTPNGKLSDSSFCPVEFYKNMVPEDLNAVTKYLKIVSPF